MNTVYVVHAQLSTKQSESDPVIRIFAGTALHSANGFCAQLNQRNKDKNIRYYIRIWELHY